MTKLTLGEKGRRLKHEIYFVGIVVLVIAVSCKVCSLIDWSAIQRREFGKTLLELEAKIVLDHQPFDREIQTLVGRCGVALRDRWLTGYLYCTKTRQGYFIGRIPTPEFRRAVEAQKPLLDADRPIERKKIPRFRMFVEFKSLQCLLLVAETETREERSPGAAVQK